MCCCDHFHVLGCLHFKAANVSPIGFLPQKVCVSVSLVLSCRYKSRGHSANRALSHTFFLLLDIMQFFDHYHAKRIDLALSVRLAPT